MGLHKWLQKVKRTGLIFFMATLFVFPLENLQAMQGQVAYKMTSNQLQEKFYKTKIDQKISLDIQGASVEDALRQIANKTGLKLTYRGDIIEKKMVNLARREIGVNDALNYVLEGTDLDYLFSEQGYLLVYETREELMDIQVQQTISGTVIDADTGEPVPGATVIVEGTSIGTTTDMDGNFSLSVPDDTESLLISFVGYQSQEISIAGQSEISVKLEQDLLLLDEMVVVGYGAVRRSDIVGSVSSVETETIASRSLGRLDQALQGSSPGLVVQNTSSAPDGDVTIRIRGVNSINGANDPLIVIDGFFGGDLSTVNPNDIESIEVLKDAASTAIYGSRGANGVILITTKGGNKNSLNVEYNNYFNFNSVSNRLDLMNASEFARTVNANRRSLGVQEVFTDQQISNFDQNGGTDWQDVLFRTALEQNHVVSVSGGGDNATYYLSGNYNTNEGIVRGSEAKRYSLRSNIESQVSDAFTVGMNVFLAQSSGETIIYGGNQDNAPTHAILVWGATQPVYNEDGSYTLPAINYGPPAVYNPLALAVEPIRESINNTVSLNGAVDYEISENLVARVNLGYRLLDSENNTYINNKPQGGAGQSQASITDSKTSLLQNTNMLTYQNTFFGVHNLNVTAAFEQQIENFNTNFAGSNGFSNDELLYNNLGLGTDPQIPSSDRTERQIISYVGRINYSFAEKYILSVTSRYDGSSVFGEENKWGFFPSIAGAWRVDSESFMDDVDWLSNLKLRASYGITGSQAVGPYSSLTRLNTNSAYPIDGNTVSPGASLGQLGNPELKWETTAQTNLGVDLALFDDRIGLTIDAYRKITSDLLLFVPLPQTSGFDGVLRNIGEVKNQGFEFVLSGYPVTGDFNWNTNINFAINRNEVLSLAQGETEIALGGPGFPNFGNTVFVEVGKPIGVLRGYIQDGIWGTDEEAEAASYGSIPGAPKYVDQNNDGVINADDISQMGNTMPKFTYGWNNTFNYKNFDLNIFIQGSYGNDIYNLSRVRSERSSSDSDATSTRILDRWTPDNQDTDVPSFEGSLGQYEYLQSSRWLEDGSYIRLKTLTLGYTLPVSLLNKINLNNVRVYASSTNLITLTDYSGYDPEASTNVDTFGGIDIGSYPSARTLTFGVNIGF